MPAKNTSKYGSEGARRMLEVWASWIAAFEEENRDAPNAVKAEALGVSVQALHQWRSGMSLPDLVNLVRISEMWGVPVENLIYDERHPRPHFPVRERVALPAPSPPPSILGGGPGGGASARTPRMRSRPVM